MRWWIKTTETYNRAHKHTHPNWRTSIYAAKPFWAPIHPHTWKGEIIFGMPSYENRSLIERSSSSLAIDVNTFLCCACTHISTWKTKSIRIFIWYNIQVSLCCYRFNVKCHERWFSPSTSVHWMYSVSRFHLTTDGQLCMCL